MGLTGAIFKGLTFDGEDSKNYGVYITGQAVYNSPERDVEMISIPGRDGAFALDRGRFSNIEVTYPAGLFGVDEADFAQAIADFRNMLGSRVGYCRLEDEYNPGEYREAVFKAGVEVTPASLESGQFDIVFECKPQRWLTSGEDAVAVTSGGTITNPTLFESRPMLQAWGYGDIDIDGQEISLVNALIGRTVVSPGGAWPITTDYTPANIGDDLLFMGARATLSPRLSAGVAKIKSVSQTGATWTTASGGTSATLLGGNISLIYAPTAMTASYGTTTTLCRCYIDAHVVAESTGGTTLTGDYRFTWEMRVNADGTIDRYRTQQVAKSDGDTIFDIGPLLNGSFSFGTIYVDSTQSALGTPTYIDLDIGEAYKIEGGVPVSVNNAVSLPAILPTLPPGATTITFDNTITQFKVVPRWWQL